MLMVFAIHGPFARIIPPIQIVLQPCVTVKRPTREAEQAIDGTRLRFQVAVRIANPMIDHACYAIFGDGQVPDRAEMVAERPDDRAGLSEIVAVVPPMTAGAVTALTPCPFSRKARGVVTPRGTVPFSSDENWDSPRSNCNTI